MSREPRNRSHLLEKKEADPLAGITASHEWIGRDGNAPAGCVRDEPPGFETRARPRRTAVAPRALMILLAAFLTVTMPPGASAQNPLLDAIDPTAKSTTEEETAETPSPGDLLREIEDSLARARQRQAALEQARETQGESAAPSPALERADQLVRVLEQRREARLRTETLEQGREAIDSILAREPSEIVGGEPPFPVPIFDGILRAWQHAAEEESKHEIVLEDRRANREIAEQEVERLDKERRRIREVVAREDAEIERIRLETELRALEDRLLIAREELALASQRVGNATIEHEIKQDATRQSRAALTWVESQLVPRKADLTDATERLDRRRLALQRQLDLARSQLVGAEGTLRATEEKTSRVDPQDRIAAEGEARRAQVSHRQQVVSLLSNQIERLADMRTTWERRYAVLGGQLDLAEAPAWLEHADTELERLTRLRRIQEAELAQTRLELTNLLRQAAEAEEARPGTSRWIELEFTDLEQVVDLYGEDLASLDEAIQLEERLRAELLDRIKRRDLGERVEDLLTRARSFWSYELTTSGDSPITPGKILIALGVFVLGLWFARTARGLLRRRLFPRVGFDAGASSAFASLTFYGLLAIVFLFALRAVNIPLTAFAVAGGALAIGIGFGSQTVISNFISGLLLLAERPIRTGDLVDIAGVIGTVESIGLRSTRIRTPDNFHIIVPNASFLESNVVNWTHEDPKIRLRVQVGVAYGSPSRRVEELLVAAAKEHPRSLPHPAPIAVFLDFGDSALLFEVRFWIRYDERTDRSQIQSDLRFRIDELFRENEIEIAFPQMDVHLDMGENTGGTEGDTP